MQSVEDRDRLVPDPTLPRLAAELDQVAGHPEGRQAGEVVRPSFPWRIPFRSRFARARMPTSRRSWHRPAMAFRLEDRLGGRPHPGVRRRASGRNGTTRPSMLMSRACDRSSELRSGRSVHQPWTIDSRRAFQEPAGGVVDQPRRRVGAVGRPTPRGCRPRPDPLGPGSTRSQAVAWSSRSRRRASRAAGPEPRDDRRVRVEERPEPAESQIPGGADEAQSSSIQAEAGMPRRPDADARGAVDDRPDSPRRRRGPRSSGSSRSTPQGTIADWSMAGVSHSGWPSMVYFWNQ